MQEQEKLLLNGDVQIAHETALKVASLSEKEKYQFLGYMEGLGASSAESVGQSSEGLVIVS